MGHGTVSAFLNANRPDYELGFAAYYGVAAAMTQAKADRSRSPLSRQRLVDAFKILHLVQERLRIPIDTPYDTYKTIVEIRTM